MTKRRRLPASLWTVSSLGLAAALAGCPSSKGGGGGTTPTPVGSTGQARSSEGVLWQAAADLDGDGKVDEITLASTQAKLDPKPEYPDELINVAVSECDQPCPATLTIGAGSQDVVIPGGFRGGIGIRVIDIDPSDKRKELLITRYGDSEEDPWREFTIVLYDGAIHLQDLWHSGGYNSGTAKIGGNGALVLEYDECPDRSTVTYVVQGTKLVETDRKVVRTKNPDECAACPFVYLRDAAGDFVVQGEILRNLNREALAASQTLALGPAAGAETVVVELREEKDEITFLDEVHLEVGGVAILPDECGSDGAFCAVDGAHHLLRRGDVLRLTFAVGAAATATSRPRLVASGYYLPFTSGTP
jgi:hypothetical protein